MDSTTDLESIVNEIDSRLPPITYFILPSGGHASAQVFVIPWKREFNALLLLPNSIILTVDIIFQT